MPPPADHVLRTPDRRASSYDILNAFRRLTGSKPRGEPLPPPPPVNPVRALSVGSLSPSAMASGPSADDSLQRITQVASDTVRPDVTGGPPELAGLIEQLEKSHPFLERADAVEKICRVLEEYPLQNILGLWSVASDLILLEQPDEVAEAGYKLLRSISLDPKLTPVERTIIFDAAAYRRTTRCFQWRLEIVSTLTNGGKNIAACESAIVPFILDALDACFKASRDAFNSSRKASGKRNADKPLQETENLGRIFQYTADVCKFNARILTDNDLEQILERAIHICQNTTQEGDMENCIKLFDIIITYVHIPMNVLKTSLEVLCAIHRQIASLEKQTWNTLSNLFKSHIGQAAIMSLLHTLKDGPSIKNRHSSLYRGTMQVLQKLVIEDGQSELPKVPMSLIFPSLKASINEPHATQEEFVVDLIDSILSQDTMRDALLAEADLSDMLEIIRVCAERDDDRLRAKMTGSVDKASTGIENSHAAANFALGNSNANSGKVDIIASPGGHEEDIGPHTDNPSVRPTGTETVRRSEDNSIFRVLVKLDHISNAMDHVQKEGVMELFLHCANRLSDTIAEKMIQYFAEERFLNPSNSDWLDVSRNVAAGTLHDSTRPNSVRLLAIKTLRNTHSAVELLCTSDIATQSAAILLDRIEVEDDIEILEALVDFAVDVADTAQLDRFSDILRLLQKKLDRPRTSATDSSHSWTSHTFLPKTLVQTGSHCDVIAVAYVRLFIRSFTHAAQKTRILYNAIRGIASNDNYDNESRLTSLRLLFRLRADSRHALTVNSSSEGERIAAELCRTEETAVATEKSDRSLSNDHTRSEDASSWREQRKVSGTSPHASLNRQTGRATAVVGRVSKPIAPLWMYPGPKGLPEEPPSEPSRVVFSHIDASKYPLNDDIHDMEITLWLELIISLLQRPPDWEIYSYVLVHLGPQLSNQALVRSCVVQLRMLRNVLCEQVRNSSFHEPPPHTLLKKADVAVCLYHILTVIISYHEYFEKSEEDDIVKAFLQGIVQWDRTSKWCIHALSVCCFEVPLSVSKSLDTIIQKLSQIVTKPTTAIHILEFLTSLARLPELYKNFREEEFKTVFGVCFRYLQHIGDQRSRAAMPSLSQRGHNSLRHSGPARDSATTSDSGSRRPHSVEEDLPHYLYSLAFHVITFWFMALRMEDRPKQIPWITKNLLTVDSAGRSSMEEQGQVIVDIMNMVAYTDRDHTVRNENFSKPGDGEVWKKTWIVNNGLLTIETAARTGISQVTSRRPCGTRFFTLRPSLVQPPRHQVPITVGLAADAFYSASYVGILPEDIFQSFYAPLDLTNTTIALPDDDMTRRAIATFDRTATIDSHKVGVIYIGEGQTNERDIFMNDIGSPAYTSFVSGLGTLCRLKDAKFNTGGLDTRDDADGEFTYMWRDRCMELVYHITTMMPTDPNDDMTYPNKKRHIGNDFVNIIFNDSGLPYNFDTFPGAFNYVHIVISPESRASFVDRRIDADPDGKDRYYKVQVISKPGFPDISPAAETKILGGRHIAAYCRLIAINACVFSDVWFQREGGEQISSWRNRLREIKRLRERYGGSINDQQPTSTPASPGGGTQGLSSPPSREQSGIASPFQRSSIVTFITEGTSRSSISSSSHDQ